MPASWYSQFISLAKAGSIFLEQQMTTFAASPSFHQAIALRTALRSDGNFALCSGSHHHDNGFLKSIGFRAGQMSGEK